MDRSQHKLSKRKCPVCGELKEFPARNATCSAECAYKRMRKETPAEGIEKIDVSGDTMSISLDETDISTLEELVERYKIDTRVWEVQRFTINSREVKEGDRHNIRAWLKKRFWAEMAIAEIDALKAQAKKFSPRVKALPRKAVKTGNMAEISMPDAHFGKLCWGRETGYADGDVEISVRQFNEAFESLVADIRLYPLDAITLVIGNDLFHTDTRQGTTTAGTQVDTDSRYHRVFRIVADITAKHIMMLREIAPVTVKVVPGNHDDLTAWHLGFALEWRFLNTEDVVIDNEPCPRKYLEWGNVMLMWAHGDGGKREDYPQLMATEQPAMWGRTKYRESHVGHLHTTRMQEFHGIRVRILPSLSGTDYWHSKNAFTGNIKSAEAYVWNRVTGLRAVCIHNVQEDTDG